MSKFCMFLGAMSYILVGVAAGLLLTSRANVPVEFRPYADRVAAGIGMIWAFIGFQLGFLLAYRDEKSERGE